MKNGWFAATEYSSLYAAFGRAAQGKWDRESVAAFFLDLESELLALQAELRNGEYAPGPYRQFWIRDRKPRLISAAPFRDRVVHHAVMAPLEPWLDRRFIAHSYACRPGKGAHKAVAYYQRQARRYPYVLKVDIARYFPSIDRAILYGQLCRYVADPALLDVLGRILDASPSGGGIPIGNLTSQIFANLYLNDIDHWLVGAPGCGAYLRYVDDLYLLGDGKADLWRLRDHLALRLDALGLKIHPRKCTLQPTTQRVDILGYQVSPVKRWLRNDNGYRARRRLKRLAAGYRQGRVSRDTVRQSVASWLGHVHHADCDALLEQILAGVVFQRP